MQTAIAYAPPLSSYQWTPGTRKRQPEPASAVAVPTAEPSRARLSRSSVPQAAGVPPGQVPQSKAAPSEDTVPIPAQGKTSDAGRAPSGVTTSPGFPSAGAGDQKTARSPASRETRPYDP